jgi:anti-anti-sigma factor
VSDAWVTVADTGRSVRLVLGGEIDMSNAVTVEDQIDAAITNQVTAVCIDLSDVTYLDSAGLRILFGLASRLPTLQIQLELVAPRESPAHRVMEISGLANLVAIIPAPRQM